MINLNYGILFAKATIKNDNTINNEGPYALIMDKQVNEGYSGMNKV